MNTTGYNKAVKVMATSMKPKGMGAFEASSLLAKMYNKPKERTLDDILKVRAKMLNIKWQGKK